MFPTSGSHRPARRADRADPPAPFRAHKSSSRHGPPGHLARVFGPSCRHRPIANLQSTARCRQWAFMRPPRSKRPCTTADPHDAPAAREVESERQDRRRRQDGGGGRDLHRPSRGSPMGADDTLTSRRLSRDQRRGRQASLQRPDPSTVGCKSNLSGAAFRSAPVVSLGAAWTPTGPRLSDLERRARVEHRTGRDAPRASRSAATRNGL